MDWFTLSLLGAAALSVTGIIDKLVLSRYVRDPLAYLAVLVLMQQLLILIIPLLFGWGFVYPETIYAIASGGLQIVLWAAYLMALQKEETSRVAAMVFVFPAFVFMGAVLLLGEALEAREYSGGALLVASALLISYRPGSSGSSGRSALHSGPHSEANSGNRLTRSAFLSPALGYMAVFWVFTASYALLSKYLLSFMNEWHLILWSSLGSLLALLPLLARAGLRREALGYLRDGRLLLLALFADELFDILGRGAFIFAYAAGSVSLVSSVAALQPFITLAYVMLLSLFVPGLISEELDSRTLALKLLAVIMIVAGVYLVS